VDHLAALLQGTAGAGDGAAGRGLAGTATIRPGRVSGPLLGGSLTLLAHLCGTPWRTSFRGAILFLEDVAEPPYKLDRYLTQLELSGALDGVAAVAVGQLTGCDGGDGEAAATVRRLVAALGVPAIEGVPAGHEDRNLALPLGARATLTAPGPGQPGAPQLRFDEGATA
jgi:muramoyltetrapeptide carboxypeptidase